VPSVEPADDAEAAKVAEEVARYNLRLNSDAKGTPMLANGDNDNHSNNHNTPTTTTTTTTSKTPEESGESAEEKERETEDTKAQPSEVSEEDYAAIIGSSAPATSQMMDVRRTSPRDSTQNTHRFTFAQTPSSLPTDYKLLTRSAFDDKVFVESRGYLTARKSTQRIGNEDTPIASRRSAIRFTYDHEHEGEVKERKERNQHGGSVFVPRSSRDDSHKLRPRR